MPAAASSTRTAGRPLRHPDRRKDLCRLHVHRDQPRRPQRRPAPRQCDLRAGRRAEGSSSDYRFAPMLNDANRGLFRRRGRRRQGPLRRAGPRLARRPERPRERPTCSRRSLRAHAHALRRDHARGRPCAQRAAAKGRGQRQLPHLPRRPRRATSSESCRGSPGRTSTVNSQSAAPNPTPARSATDIFDAVRAAIQAQISGRAVYPEMSSGAIGRRLHPRRGHPDLRHRRLLQHHRRNGRAPRPRRTRADRRLSTTRSTSRGDAAAAGRLTPRLTAARSA